MTNYPGLLAQIALPAYAGMTDVQITAALNAATVATIIDTSVPDVFNVLVPVEWHTVRVLQQSGLSASVGTATAGQIAAVVAYDLLSGNFGDIRTSSPTTAAKLDLALTALNADTSSGGPAVSAASVAAIQALRVGAPTSAAVILGFPSGVSVSDLAAARASL